MTATRMTPQPKRSRNVAITRKRGPSERELQEACCGLLELDGWRRLRTDLQHLRGLGVAEKGIADDLFIRYHWEAVRLYRRTVLEMARTELIWVEWKAPKGKAAQHQVDWHAQERARGALTWIAGVDFPASVDGFLEHYRASGLMRNNLR